MSNLWRWISGGRPMHYLSYAFRDIVVHRDVNHYQDTYGRIWLAHNRWGWFRVRVDDEDQGE